MVVTSKHDGFEEFRDLEPEQTEEDVDQVVYEGIVLHACSTAMEEMVSLGREGDLFKLLADALSGGKSNESKRTRDDAQALQG